MSREYETSELVRSTDLRPDCERCCALCCVAPALLRSRDFAIDKRPGEPCPHLQADFRCGIHSRLRAEGFRGCAAYDCLGAGQKVTQLTFKGADWRLSPQIAQQMFEVFSVMRQLHQLLRYLAEALELQPAGSLHPELVAAFKEVEQQSLKAPEELRALDLDSLVRRVDGLLTQVSERVRASAARAVPAAGRTIPDRTARGDGSA